MGSAEPALEAPGLAAVPALDVVLADPLELEVDGWSLVGGVSALGCGWAVLEVGVGAGEFVGGAGLLGVVVVACGAVVG